MLERAPQKYLEPQDESDFEFQNPEMCLYKTWNVRKATLQNNLEKNIQNEKIILLWLLGLRHPNIFGVRKSILNERTIYEDLLRIVCMHTYLS